MNFLTQMIQKGMPQGSGSGEVQPAAGQAALGKKFGQLIMSFLGMNAKATGPQQGANPMTGAASEGSATAGEPTADGSGPLLLNGMVWPAAPRAEQPDAALDAAAPEGFAAFTGLMQVPNAHRGTGGVAAVAGSVMEVASGKSAAEAATGTSDAAASGGERAATAPAPPLPAGWRLTTMAQAGQVTMSASTSTPAPAGKSGGSAEGAFLGQAVSGQRAGQAPAAVGTAAEMLKQAAGPANGKGALPGMTTGEAASAGTLPAEGRERTGEGARLRPVLNSSAEAGDSAAKGAGAGLGKTLTGTPPHKKLMDMMPKEAVARNMDAPPAADAGRTPGSDAAKQAATASADPRLSSLKASGDLFKPVQQPAVAVDTEQMNFFKIGEESGNMDMDFMTQDEGGEQRTAFKFEGNALQAFSSSTGRRTFSTELVRQLQQSESSKPGSSTSWNHHRFTMDDGNAVNVAVRHADGALQLQISAGNTELNKIIQQHIDEIRQHLQEQMNVEIDLQMQHFGGGEAGEQQEQTSPGNAGPLTGGRLTGSSPEQPMRGNVRYLGFNNNEWTA